MKKMKDIETIIPVYRPAPCDCCTQDVGADLKTKKMTNKTINKIWRISL